MSYFGYYVSPNTTTLFALFALAFPLLFLANTLTMIFWLFKRKKLFLLSTIILLSGSYHLSRFIQISWNTSPNDNEFTLMSYNVRLFDLYNWSNNEETRNDILNFLQSENPDIICFQEYFYTSSNYFNTRDTLLQLIDAKNYIEQFTDSVTEPKTNGKKSYFGSAIYTKYPIINNGNIIFDNDHSNHAMWADILINDDTIRIFNAHLGSIRFQPADYDIIGGKGNPQRYSSKQPQNIIGRLNLGFRKRVGQSIQVIEEIKKSPYPVILCTDMNDTPLSYTYNQFSDILNDCFIEKGNGIGSTYIGNYPFLRIDYIWHDNHINCSGFNTLGVDYSDHRPVKARLRIK